MPNIISRLNAAEPEGTDYEELTAQVTVDKPVAITSDLHAPYVDKNVIEKLYLALARHQADELWILGDITHQDAFSRWEGGLGQATSVFREEMAYAREILYILFENVPTVRVFKGNHDARLIRDTRAQLGMQELMTMIFPDAAPFEGGVGKFRGKDKKERRLYVSELPTLSADVYGEPWLFTHPDGYSKKRGQIAVDLTAIYHRNVGVGHTHHWAMIPDDSGKYWALELGGLFDARRFDYPYEKPTASPKMTNGFFVIDGGEVVPYRGRREG